MGAYGHMSTAEAQEVFKSQFSNWIASQDHTIHDTRFQFACPFCWVCFLNSQKNFKLTLSRQQLLCELRWHLKIYLDEKHWSTLL